MAQEKAGKPIRLSLEQENALGPSRLSLEQENALEPPRLSLEQENALEPPRLSLEQENELCRYYHILRVEFSVRDAEILAVSPPTDRLAAVLYSVKRILSAGADRVFTVENAPVVKAVLLGEKGLLDDDTKELYQGAGIIHIFSISGLHITLIGTGVFTLLGFLRIPLPVRAATALAVIYLYGKMIGMGTSVFRAIVMFSLYLIAKAIGRTYDLLTAAGIACLLLLLDQPLYFLHTGFLFTFAAVLSIGMP